MILRMADANTEAGVMPSEPLLAAMGKYMEEMAKAGVLLAGEGLKPTSTGARVELRSGKPRVIDGPFAESKELIAGYCIIRVGSREEALDWVKRWPPLDGDITLEVRQIYEVEELGPEFTPELRAAEERLRAQLPANG